MKRIKLAIFIGVFFFANYLLWLGPFITVKLTESAFSDLLNDYVLLRYPLSKSNLELAKSPYLKGKILVVKQKKAKMDPTGRKMNPDGQIDKSWYLLPRKIRARSPDDLDTLLVLTYQKATIVKSSQISKDLKRVAWKEKTSTGFPIKQFDVYVKVFDMRKDIKIGETIITGLPELIDTEDVKLMYKLITEFINEMPTKP